ncbi:hypothetical protein NPA31_011945 [Aurantimonas sp. MSK8Z-1]|uniref:hypothetical protein n=1 Tax=Mangrovibrevibacter kandeliae TaxID=2968473 RepID=UPI002118CA04|nr:hypothetical protein [Aurantimonas sp. MSK8Z-1]MCW4115676.1 hypothetical protein [Aurantimonas sp. MSK8Z-1]
MADPWADFLPRAAPTADPWADFLEPASASAANNAQRYDESGVPVGGMDAAPAAPTARAEPAPAAPAASGWADVPASAASGIVRGAAETAMAPATLSRLFQSGMGLAYAGADDLVRSIIGAEPLSETDRAAILDPPAPLDRAVYAAQDVVRNIMGDTLYEPKTTAGKFAETIGEFAVPGGVPSKATRLAPTAARKAGEYGADLVRNAVIPGALSEGAGQATEGTAAEPYARVAGAVVGNVGGAAAKAASAPEQVLRRALGDEDIDWARAVGLQDNGTGIRLTGPEAIAQAQGGATALPNLQRVVEGSTEGRAATAPFFAARPGQVDTAVGGLLDKISPQSPNPSVLGPRASEAAQTVIDRTRQGINAQTEPLYTAAGRQLIPDADFAPLRADPRFQTAIERLRNSSELGPDYAQLPDNSVAVVDAVTKDMFARGEALANRANPLYGPELAARNTAGAVAARDAARAASPEYDQALAQQTQMRRDVLQPVAEGPLGRVAAADTTQTAGNAILPQNPLSGSAGEAADATRRLTAQDPETTRGLVRQNLADRYAKAATETQTGDRSFTGAKFHKDVAGNASRDEVLHAVLGALDRPDAAQAAPELLDVLQATGRRQPIGSATEFNRSLNAELGAGSPMARTFSVAKTLGANFLTHGGDAVSRMALRNSLGQLADLFTDPNSVELIRQAASRGARPNLGEAARTTGREGLVIYGGQPQNMNTSTAATTAQTSQVIPPNPIADLIDLIMGGR